MSALHCCPQARRVSAIALMLLIGGAAVGTRPQGPPPQRAAGTLTEGVTAVLVDVVVRDRGGQPVKDLTAGDFEILEDGVRQSVGSFTRVFQGDVPASPASAPAAPAAAAGAAAAAAQPAAGSPGVTALVFHSLTPEGRRLALQSAQNYLGDREEMANYVGVFGIDLGLRPLVPFTRNGVAVRRALEAIARSGAPGFNTPEFQQQKADAQRNAASSGQTAAASQNVTGPGASAAVGSAGASAQLAMMQSRMLDEFTNLERDQSGYITTDALQAIVSNMGLLPGRKSVVLFSEGVSVPPAVHRLFLGVVDAANRANVSIYTIDAAGLRAESEQGRIRDQVNASAGFGLNTAYSNDGAGGPLTRGLEGNEFNLRSDPATTLGQLAEDTGGLLFSNTNNLRSAFERIESDLHNYYLLGYTPTNPAYDGRFRTIQVKVNRPGVTVASRKGYFAVRNPGSAPINEWEASALGALEARPVPNAFPVFAAALAFPERGRPGLTPVVVELKTAPIAFRPAADGKSYSSDFTVLVRFVDQNGQVVRKVSQHYDIRGELAQIDRATQGEVLFYRESELPPGLYSMETVVHDAVAGKSSVRFATIEVPRYEEGTLRMSSLILVKRGEEVPEKDRRPDNPLLVNGVALQPNLGAAVSRASKEMGFYFAIYPAAQGRGPDVRIELLQNGKPVVQLPMPVPPADGSGRIQQLGRLPIGNIAAGTYELRALVRQGDAQVVRSTLLRIVE